MQTAKVRIERIKRIVLNLLRRLRVAKTPRGSDPLRRDVSWSSLFDPGLVSVRALLEVGQEQGI